MCESALFSLHRTHKGTPKQYCYISNFLSSGIIWDTVYVKSHTNPYCYLSARALQHYGTAGNQGWSWEWSQGYSWTLDFGSSVTKIQTWIKNWCLQKQQRPDRRETATYKFNDSCTETSLHPQLTVRTIPMQFLIALGCSCFFLKQGNNKSLLRPLLTPAVSCNPLSVQLHHWDQLPDCSANSVTLTAVSFTALRNRWL